MSEGKPQREPSSDTQEFEAIRRAERVDARTEFEMVGNHRLFVKPDFQHPVELRLGRDEQTPTCYLIPKPWNRKYDEQYVILQPDVFRADRRRGWVEVGTGSTNHVGLGRLVSPQFDLGPDVSRRHCLVAVGTSPVDGNSDVLEIESYGQNGLRVSVHPDDIVRGMTVGGVEAFDAATGDTWTEEAENDPEMDHDAEEALRRVEEEVAKHPEINADEMDGKLRYLGLDLD
jgi:hypothetical protein